MSKNSTVGVDTCLPAEAQNGSESIATRIKVGQRTTAQGKMYNHHHSKCL